MPGRAVKDKRKLEFASQQGACKKNSLSHGCSLMTTMAALRHLEPDLKKGKLTTQKAIDHLHDLMKLGNSTHEDIRKLKGKSKKDLVKHFNEEGIDPDAVMGLKGYENVPFEGKFVADKKSKKFSKRSVSPERMKRGIEKSVVSIGLTDKKGERGHSVNIGGLDQKRAGNWQAEFFDPWMERPVNVEYKMNDPRPFSGRTPSGYDVLEDVSFARKKGTKTPKDFLPSYDEEHTRSLMAHNKSEFKKLYKKNPSYFPKGTKKLIG